MLSLKDLTFGLELEIICTRRLPFYADPDFDHHYYDPDSDYEEDEDRGHPIRTAIATKLRSLGIAVIYSANKSKKPHYGVWNICNDVSIEYDGEDIVSSLWGLDPDDLVLPDADRWQLEAHGECYSYADVELITPVFRWHDPHWRAQVCAVIDAVTTGEFRSCVNVSCGLHLHVGQGMNGFSVSEAKRVAAAAMVLEARTDQLHPRHRRNNCNACSLRWKPELSSLSTAELFKAIWQVESIMQLTNLLQGDGWGIRRCCKLNLRPLLGAKRTIEFRQHAATLSMDEIEPWVELVANLVVAAVGIKASELAKIVMAIQSEEDGHPIGLDPLFDGFVNHDRLRAYYEETAAKYDVKD